MALVLAVFVILAVFAKHVYTNKTFTKVQIFNCSILLMLLVFGRNTAKEMFYHAYTSYMKYAFPMDELNPLQCSGNSRNYFDPQKFHLNDVLGDFCLTLIDSMDTLYVNIPIPLHDMHSLDTGRLC